MLLCLSDEIQIGIVPELAPFPADFWSSGKFSEDNPVIVGILQGRRAHHFATNGCELILNSCLGLGGPPADQGVVSF